MGVLCLVLVLLFSGLCPANFSIILMERAGCFALTVYLMMSCDSHCSVALPHGIMGWSAVCDCGISLSYLLALLRISSNRLGEPGVERGTPGYKASGYVSMTSKQCLLNNLLLGIVMPVKSDSDVMFC